MTHRRTPDFARMANAAREARQRQEEERQATLITELELVTGEAYVEIQDLYDDTDLDHEAKMARFRAAILALRGETAVVVSSPVASATSIAPRASSVTEQQQSAETEAAEGSEPDSSLSDRVASAPKAEPPAKKVPKKAPEKESEPEEVVPPAQPKKLSLKERVGRAWNGID